MNTLWKWLDGNKTHLCALGIFLVSGAEGVGWISKEVADLLKGFLVAGGLSALRLAIKK